MGARAAKTVGFTRMRTGLERGRELVLLARELGQDALRLLRDPRVAPARQRDGLLRQYWQHLLCDAQQAALHRGKVEKSDSMDSWRPGPLRGAMQERTPRSRQVLYLQEQNPETGALTVDTF